MIDITRAARAFSR